MLARRPGLTIGRIFAVAVAVVALSVVLALADATSRYDSPRTAMAIVIAAAAALAAITAINLANLTLADIRLRRGDFAVRAALGASTCQLVLPELVQSAVVAALGTAAGLAGAAVVVPAMLAPYSGVQLGSVSPAVAALGGGAGTLAIMFAAAAAPVLRVCGRLLAREVCGHHTTLYFGRGPSVSSRAAPHAGSPAGTERLHRDLPARARARGGDRRLPSLRRLPLG